MSRISILEKQHLAFKTGATFERLFKDYGRYANLLGAFAHPPALQHLFGYLVQSKKDGLPLQDFDRLDMGLQPDIG